MSLCPHLCLLSVHGSDGVALAPGRGPHVGAELQQHPAPIDQPQVLGNHAGVWGCHSHPKCPIVA